MEPQAATEIAKLGAQRVAAALENLQETDSQLISNLGTALAALANKMAPYDVVEVAKGLAAALDRPQWADSERLSPLGESLAVFCRLLPSAHRTHLLALSNMLLQPGQDFGGDVWKFVGKADSLGIKDIDSPATRPLVQGALNELVGLQVPSRNTDGQSAVNNNASLVSLHAKPILALSLRSHMDLRLHAIRRHFESEIKCGNTLLKLKRPADQRF
jgi:hypothetical protein